jgi:arylsulfatase A
VPCLMQWPGKIPADKSNNNMLMTIDLLPTIARLVGANLPKHKIDGLDVWHLIAGKSGARNPHDAYFVYYEVGALHAVMSGDGRWKLQFPHKYPTLAGRRGGNGGVPAKYSIAKITEPELYDLRSDVSEKINVAAKYPDIVQRLSKFADEARADLGDSLVGIKGANTREPGAIKNN